MAENERLLGRDEAFNLIENGHEFTGKYFPQSENMMMKLSDVLYIQKHAGMLEVLNRQDSKTASQVAGEIIQIVSDWFEHNDDNKLLMKYPDWNHSEVSLPDYLKSRYGIK